MNLFRWFSDDVLGVPHDERWVWFTIALSTLIAIGYAVIAFNWYFQTKLLSHAESKTALNRLRNIVIICATCGVLFYASSTPWVLWRIYDAFLLFLVIHTWLFVFHMRGLSLVDERLAQMEELEKSAKRYRDIAELLPHMVWTATADGKIDYSNQPWREFVNDHRTWLEAVHPDDLSNVAVMWNQTLVSRQTVSFEARLGGPVNYRTFVIRATPIVQGDAIKWLGACADIEDQKQLAAEKELQAKQKSFFLNAVSHDLRAPLHNILLNAHLLKLSVQDPDDVESVEMIMENSTAAGDLVTKLLDFAKVGAQEGNTIESIPVDSTLHHLERRFLPIAEQKGLYLRLKGDSNAKISTDRQKLERILSNLVDNAIKYTQQGGVTLETVVENSEVSVRVSDTGIGIPQTNVPYLFDEFYQVNNYERDRSKGFGMGLAICKSLAKHIGADVRLARTGPEGSCFEVAVKKVDPDRGGRPGGENRDLPHPQEARLCSI